MAGHLDNQEDRKIITEDNFIVLWGSKTGQVTSPMELSPFRALLCASSGLVKCLCFPKSKLSELHNRSPWLGLKLTD